MQDLTNLILILEDGFCHELRTNFSPEEVFFLIKNLEKSELIQEIR